MLRARFCKLLSLIPSLSGRCNVRVTSAYITRAAQDRTFLHFAFGPLTDSCTAAIVPAVIAGGVALCLVRCLLWSAVSLPSPKSGRGIVAGQINKAGPAGG